MALHPVTDEERRCCDPHARSPKWTICELLRKIYAMGEARGDKEIVRLAHDALCYAKRMNDKLSEKDPKYADGWFYDKRWRKTY